MSSARLALAARAVVDSRGRARVSSRVTVVSPGHLSAFGGDKRSGRHTYYDDCAGSGRVGNPVPRLMGEKDVAAITRRPRRVW